MRVLRRPVALGVSVAAAAIMFALPASAHDPDTPEGKAAAAAYIEDRKPADAAASVRGGVPCANGHADKYECHNVDLQSVLPLNEIGGGNGNDIWGWVDPQTQREYAIMGRTNGTAFVDVTNPTEPVFLGNLPSHEGSSIWRDIKVYKDHAFIVADAIKKHGMQVFDLSRLRGVTSPQTFTEDAHYSKIGPAHNIAINEDTGFAYAVGSNTCRGGPHMIDIRDPRNPQPAGCVSEDGYTHDTQCVVYHGPDAAYTGRELCFNANEDTVTVVDVTDKANPVQVARKPYDGASYSHQGWLTEDHRFYVHDDELDEYYGVDKRTKTYIFDMAALADPKPAGVYTAPVESIDHNQYVRDGLSYQANYQSGLRIVDLAGVAEGTLREVGFFDIYPEANTANFNGSWSNYPYLPSGNVLISGIEQGLVVVKPRV